MEQKPKKGPTTDDDIVERETWSNPAEFVLSCLGYAVGLGNIWRFPYVCFENGGGAFLIPYAIMLTFVGIPVFLMELIMGQYSAKGPLHVWDISPVFKGLGVGMIFINSMFCIFYTMIIGYSLYYMVLSFFDPLPWDSCTHDFNTENCYNKKEAIPCEQDLNGTWYNNTCYNDTYFASFDENLRHCNDTGCFYYEYNELEEHLGNLTAKTVSSAEEYFNLGILRLSDGIEHTGDVVWQLCCALLAGWILCYFCLLKGIKSSGKVIYFTALFPYAVLIILLIYGSLLPGSYEGIKFYVTPDWAKLKTAKVWVDAAGQIFFSLSVGGGGLMTFASYNKFHNNIYRDALIVSIGNCLTSFFAGFVVFGILGYMAFTLEKEVPDVVVDGSTLAFVAYPTVLARMPVPQLWSVLFFFMLLTLGLDSLFAGMEANITAFIDSFPRTRRYKWVVTLVLCIVFFLLGLPMTTQAGVYWLNVIAYYATGWALIILGLVETIVFAWVYGAKKVRQHVNEMVGFDIGVHWLAAWYFITPAILIAILVFSIIDFAPLSFGPYQLPDWAQAIGWCIALFPVASLLVFAVITTFQMIGCRRAKMLFRPNENWRPSYLTSSNTDHTTGRAKDYTPEMMDDIASAENGGAPAYDNSTFISSL